MKTKEKDRDDYVNSLDWSDPGNRLVRDMRDDLDEVIAALQASLARFEDIEDDARVLLAHAPQFESMILGIRVVAQQGIDTIAACDGVADAPGKGTT